MAAGTDGQVHEGEALVRPARQRLVPGQLQERLAALAEAHRDAPGIVGLAAVHRVEHGGVVVGRGVGVRVRIGRLAEGVMSSTSIVQESMRCRPGGGCGPLAGRCSRLPYDVPGRATPTASPTHHQEPMSVSLALPALPLPGPFDGVVVDMDGLLVHTERQWLEAKTDPLRALRRGAHGGRPAGRLRRRRRCPRPSTSRAAWASRPRASRPCATSTSPSSASSSTSGVELTPGAAEFIERLAEAAPLALASNTRRTLVDRVLAARPSRTASTSSSAAMRPRPSRPRTSTCWPARSWASTRPEPGPRGFADRRDAPPRRPA